MTNNKRVTSKKVKVIGQTEYINKETGELETFQTIKLEDKDANFHKIWLWHIAESLNLIGNQKTKILIHIMENLNGQNQYIGTQRKIAEKLKMSTQTVTITIKVLQEANFLKLLHSGVYAVNPEAIFKGGKGRRMNVLLEYNNIGYEEVNEEERENEENLKNDEN